MTVRQAEILYLELQKSLELEYTFQAKVHGIDIEDKKSAPQNSTTTSTNEVAMNGAPAIFGDPKSYTGLSKAEAESMTARMKSTHTRWMDDGLKTLSGQKNGR